jgi:hypothetical protein
MLGNRLAISRAASAEPALPASANLRRRLMAASAVLMSNKSSASRAAPSASRFATFSGLRDAIFILGDVVAFEDPIF